MLPGISLPVFVAAASIAAIVVTDDGDATETSGGNTANHTYTSQTTTGPFSFVAVTYYSTTSTPSITSATWNGNAVAILVDRQLDVSGIGGVAILYIVGAQTGSLVIHFSDTVDHSEITKVSMSNLQSGTPVDTDSVDGNAGNGIASLAALATPGVGGARLGAYFCGNTGSVAWTNGTAIADLTARSTWRHSVAYDLGNDGGTITADGSSAANLAVGVSMR